MFFELVAVLVAGLGGAGIALVLNKVLGGRLPRWIVPVAAGAAMLATTIANEYGWYGRTVEALPDGLQVAVTVEDRAIYRPWAYVFPFVSRFLAVDRATMRTNRSMPDLRLVEVYAFGRWTAPKSRLVMVDCKRYRRADVPQGAAIAQDGSVEGLVWIDAGATDPVIAASCAEG